MIHRGGRFSIVVAVVGLVAALLVPAVPALANDDDVIREGNCSGASDWKLKLSPENGAIEVEWEIDQNVVGQTWGVAVEQNGTVVFRGARTTTAPSGSFELRIVRPNNAGPDSFRAAARNRTTGETCLGAATATF